MSEPEHRTHLSFDAKNPEERAAGAAMIDQVRAEAIDLIRESKNWVVLIAESVETTETTQSFECQMRASIEDDKAGLSLVETWLSSLNRMRDDLVKKEEEEKET